MQSRSLPPPGDLLRGRYHKIFRKRSPFSEPLPPSGNTDKPFPFLLLPRELRDEIYSYLLRFDPAEDPFAIPVPLFRHHYLDTSILCTNKQVHDEASRFLYSQNVFPMEIVIQGSDSYGWNAPPGDNIGYKLQTGYKSVWERFNHVALLPYGFHELSEARFFKIAGVASEIDDETHDINAEAPQIPAPRYYRHLRHIKINIVDLRRPRLLQMPMIASNFVRPTLQTAYQPIVHHLKPLLEAAGSALTVHINILSIEHMQHTGRNVSNELLYWKQFETRRGGPATDHHSDAYYFPLYEDLVRIVWPFTVGSWQYKIRTSMDEVFGDRVQATLRACDEHAVLDRSVREFKPYFLASGCCWVVKRGRRVVGRLSAQHEDTGFRDLDGNWYRRDHSWLY